MPLFLFSLSFFYNMSFFLEHYPKNWTHWYISFFYATRKSFVSLIMCLCLDRCDSALLISILLIILHLCIHLKVEDLIEIFKRWKKAHTQKRKTLLSTIISSLSKVLYLILRTVLLQ